MAGLYNSSFDEGTDNTDLWKYGLKITSGTASVVKFTSVTGGKALEFGTLDTSTASVYVTGYFPSDQTGNTLYIGFNFTLNSNHIAETGLFQITNYLGAEFCSLHISPTNVLFAARTSTTLATGVRPLTLGVSYFIELKIYVHGTTGIFDCRIDGVSDFTFTGNTKAATTTDVSQFKLTKDHSATYTTNYYIDNLYILNNQGSVHNTYLGPGYISKIIHPNGDNSVQFTRASGSTNWEMVDENLASVDDTTTMNSSSTVGHIDKLEMETVSSIGTIAWVTAAIILAKDNPGPRTVSYGVEYSGTAQTATVAPSIDFDVHRKIYETSDGASTAWNSTSLGGILGRYKIET